LAGGGMGRWTARRHGTRAAATAGVRFRLRPPDVEAGDGKSERANVCVAQQHLARDAHADAAYASQHHAEHHHRPPPPVARRRPVRAVADCRAEQLRHARAAEHDAEHHRLLVVE